MTEIRDRRQRHWFWVDDAVIDQHATALGPFGVALYMLLVRHADKHGQSYPSLSHLQELLGGASRNTVKKYLALLVERGLVSYERRDDPQGDQTSHLYTILTVTKSPEPSVPKSNEIDEGGRSTIDLPLSPSDSPEGVGQPLTGVGQPLTGVGQPLTYGRSTIDLRVGQPLTPKELDLEGRGSEGSPSPTSPPAGERGDPDDAVACEEKSADAPCPTPDPPPPPPAKEAPWGKTMTPEAAACLLCDWRELVEVWQADGTPVLCRCPHDGAALERLCTAKGYTLEPPEPDARSP